IHFITPQLYLTNNNYNLVPTVETSNTFAAKAIPSLDEIFVLINFRYLQNIDFHWLLAMMQGSFISQMNTLFVPCGIIV
ncbi:phosphoribulokinase, partial [Klebsiella pneumoniae]|nr:phosphoribulokinase [Klebsiella pneumoniae]